MDRRRVLSFTGTMRDSEGETVHLIGPRIVARLVAQKAEKRNNPGVASDTRG